MHAPSKGVTCSGPCISFSACGGAAAQLQCVPACFICLKCCAGRPDLRNTVSCTASASGSHSQLHVNDGQDVRAPGLSCTLKDAVICLAHKFTLPVLSSRRPTMPDSWPPAAHTAGGMPARGTAAGRRAGALLRPPTPWRVQRLRAQQGWPHARGGRARLPRLGARGGGWAAGQPPPALVSAGWRRGRLAASPMVRAAPAVRGRQAAPMLAWARMRALRSGRTRALHAGRLAPALRLQAPSGPFCCWCVPRQGRAARAPAPAAAHR